MQFPSWSDSVDEDGPTSRAPRHSGFRLAGSDRSNEEEWHEVSLGDIAAANEQSHESIEFLDDADVRAEERGVGVEVVAVLGASIGGVAGGDDVDDLHTPQLGSAADHGLDEALGRGGDTLDENAVAGLDHGHGLISAHNLEMGAFVETLELHRRLLLTFGTKIDAAGGIRVDHGREPRQTLADKDEGVNSIWTLCSDDFGRSQPCGPRFTTRCVISTA